jgi:transposase-like protein
MTRKQYDLNFKKMIVGKGKEIGNMTAVPRQHELDPKMVLRWARELKRKDLDQLDGTSVKQANFVPTAEDYSQLEKELEKLKKLYAEQALEREILKDLLMRPILAALNGYRIAVPYFNEYGDGSYAKEIMVY